MDEALRIVPYRLDIMLGRAAIAADAHDWRALSQTLERAAVSAQSDPKTLRWLEEMPSAAPVQLVADAIHSNVAAAFMERTSAADERAGKLIAMGLKYSPNDVKLLNDEGSAHAFREDWSLALPFYEQASKIAPDDSIVLSDLARVYEKLNEFDKARTAAKILLALNNDRQAVDEAQH